MDAPTLPLLLAYRLLGWRLGPAHRAWTHRDITTRGYLLRQGLPMLAALGTALVLVFAGTGADPSRTVPPLLAVLLLAVVFRKVVVQRALAQQGLTPDGQVDPVARPWFEDPERLRRRSVTAAATTVLLVVAALVLIGLGPRA